MRTALYPLTYPLAFVLGLVFKLAPPFVLLSLIDGETPANAVSDAAMARMILVTLPLMGAAIVLGTFNALTRSHMMVAGAGIGAAIGLLNLMARAI